jgi:hypothetical protein
MSTRDDDRDYEVGYGRPPKATQFKKGRSGNPKGRPKNAKVVTASLRKELTSKITVTEGQKQMTISKAEAAAKRVVAKALGGDVKTLIKLIELDASLFGGNGEEGAEQRVVQPETVDLDILRHYFTEQQTEAGAPDSDEDDGS